MRDRDETIRENCFAAPQSVPSSTAVRIRFLSSNLLIACPYSPSSQLPDLQYRALRNYQATMSPAFTGSYSDVVECARAPRYF